MTDPQGPTAETPPFADEPPEAPDASTGKTGGLDIQAMLGQLQAMIGKVASASEPALREVAAKAAELAAVAAERAGPLAHTLADKTQEVGHSIADHASSFASSMRAPSKGDATVTNETPPVGDPAEESPRDGA
jgi:hypothetical protein